MSDCFNTSNTQISDCFATYEALISDCFATSDTEISDCFATSDTQISDYFNTSDFQISDCFDTSNAQIALQEYLPEQHVDNFITLQDTKPYLKIIRQPVENFRYRYKSENKNTKHGILHSSQSSHTKTYPTVQLENYSEPAIIRCVLYQSNEPLPHPHRLIVRDSTENEKDEPHDVFVSEENQHTAVFKGMSLEHIGNMNVVNELFNKKKHIYLQQKPNRTTQYLTRKEEAEIKTQAEEESKLVDMNIVRLRFEAYRLENDQIIPICDPVYSNKIFNSKSTKTTKLTISRMNQTCGSCRGGNEIFMFVDKVPKNDIQVRFFECDEEDKEIWHAYGKFSSLDVHHQYAIVFRTPPYRDTNIDSIVTVCVELVRPSDRQRSEPRLFKYKPLLDKLKIKQKKTESETIPEILPLLNTELGDYCNSPDLNFLIEHSLPIYEKIVNESNSEIFE